MRIQIESTDQITKINDVPVRVWKGTSEAGIDCFVFVHRLAVHKSLDASQFDAELKEQLPPAHNVPLSAVL